MFKTVKENDVKEVLINLLDENGSTTALDVKKLLRKKGFWALQKNVSNLLNEVYREFDIIRTNNGSYLVYEYDTSEKEYKDDSICESSNNVNQDTLEDNTKLSITIKSKIIGSPELVDDNNETYELIIECDGNKTKLFVSKVPYLNNINLVYEVRTNNGTWYLYSEDPNIITRHRAIYYVWKVISNEYDKSVKYSELRSTKLF